MTVASFIVPLVFGYLLPAAVKQEVFRSLVDKFAALGGGREGAGLIWPIFFNNATAALFMVVSGVLIALPVFFIVMNGLSIGILLDAVLRATAVSATSVSVVIISIIPHGVIELPMILLAAVYGTLFGLKTILGRHLRPGETRFGFFRQTVKVFAFVILPLLFAAAVIEATLTPRLAEAVLRRDVARLEEEPSLEPFMLTASDLVLLGLPAERVPLSASIGEAGWNPENWRGAELFARLFDEEFYVRYREIKRQPVLIRAFRTEAATVTVRLRSFAGERPAQQAIKFEELLAVEALENGDRTYTQIADDDSGAVLYRIGEGSGPTWFVIGSVGPHTYSLEMNGITEGLAVALARTQAELLREKQK
ncbi:MAG: hypothetical protein UY92_C0012G0006 [Candidatus Magasanikbacteria bacterium GW2011_GWA2_56_11]|uniref:Stage II sporulation protein M n=1 Tax=Candidatus Magasanikbacteria bacterium GW2011_GWA2_56_11 TaxID=1619044 RepID=A0A0G2AKY1_9BACT|nr:MAG: hypothetical protein UY92_C0012G0006 [Candidatus Magasanikbacteria bacterium GW2011_GWA2_56_11]